MIVFLPVASSVAVLFQQHPGQTLAAGCRVLDPQEAELRHCEQWTTTAANPQAQLGL